MAEVCCGWGAASGITKANDNRVFKQSLLMSIGSLLGMS